MGGSRIKKNQSMKFRDKRKELIFELEAEYSLSFGKH